MHSVHSVGFQDLLPQKSVQTEDDVAQYQEKGYMFIITEKEFHDFCSVDPSCIWYIPSLACSGIYYNPATLAICYFPVEQLRLDYLSGRDFETSVKKVEDNASRGDFHISMMALPDQMRLEYIDLLVKQKADVIQNLYSFFLWAYQTSDFGFNKLDSDIFQIVISKRTTEEELEVQKRLSELPDEFTVYRGCGALSTSETETFSWTMDVNVANLFAVRFSTGSAYILTGKAKREDVIDLFLDDSEKEVLIAPNKVFDIQHYELLGLDTLSKMPSQTISLYHTYRNRLSDLDFAREGDGEHGPTHEARVLLLSLLIADYLSLSHLDHIMLATAAIYHDTQRANDYDDPEHGLRARQYYERDVSHPDPLTAFLIEYHDQPDKEGYTAITCHQQLRKQRKKAKTLLNVFKDADALDRVRFGMSELDVNQLRIPISKKLPLLAELCVRNIKI